MQEVTSPIIAIVLVLCAVFIPIAFLGGLTGELYRQFAVTISIAVVISGFVALTLTPSLCAIVLKKEHKHADTWFGWFNRGFARVTDRYENGVAWMIRRGGIALAPLCRHGGAHRLLWRTVPGSLVPDEDQGWYFSPVILPDGASLARTDKVGGGGERRDPLQPVQRARDGVHRLRLRRRLRLPRERGHHLRHAEALGRAPDAGRRAGGRVLRQDRAHQGRARDRLPAAGDLRPRHRGRLRVLHPEPRRRRPEAPLGGHAAVHRRGLAEPEDRDGEHLLARQRAAALRRRRPREGEVARRAARRHLQHARRHARQLLRQRLQQVRPHLAGAAVRRVPPARRAPRTRARCTCAARRAR